jgi:hypothetical protein
VLAQDIAELKLGYFGRDAGANDAMSRRGAIAGTTRSGCRC